MSRRQLTPTLANLAFGLLWLCACGTGTGTGNPVVGDGRVTPANVPSGAGPSTAPAASISPQILTTICSTLTTCYPSLSTVSCLAGVSVQTNIAAALGLPSGYGSFEAIIIAELAGTLIPNRTPGQQCVSDIQNLSCTGSAVMSAWASTDPTNFSNVVNLVPTGTSSCKGTF